MARHLDSLRQTMSPLAIVGRATLVPWTPNLPTADS